MLLVSYLWPVFTENVGELELGCAMVEECVVKWQVREDSSTIMYAVKCWPASEALICTQLRAAVPSI